MTEQKMLTFRIDEVEGRRVLILCDAQGEPLPQLPAFEMGDSIRECELTRTDVERTLTLKILLDGKRAAWHHKDAMAAGQVETLETRSYEPSEVVPSWTVRPEGERHRAGD